jgi:multidrug efflux pump
MALAIGVVIDDAIIVLENIERHREMGKSGRDAAGRHAPDHLRRDRGDAHMPLTAVFLPVIFVQGIVGNMLGEFGLTVAGSVLISLFVALTLTPMLARVPAPKERAHGSFYHYLEVGFEKIRPATSARSIGRSATSGRCSIALCRRRSRSARRQARQGDVPVSDQSMFFTASETPPGTAIEATTDIPDINEKYMLAQPQLVGLL